MPRRLRVFFPGVAAHVVQRAVDGRPCFRQEKDYILYLHYLGKLSARHQVRVHAYCLMTNHVHLLLSPETADGCQAMMKELGHHYSQYFNRTYGRNGPLWGGRYYSCIAESSLYVLACYRYIELNPVRAGLAGHPAEYRWSSYGFNAEGKQDSLVMVALHDELVALASEDFARRRSYKDLLAESLDQALLERIRESTIGGRPLTSEAFKSGMAAKDRSVSDTDL